MTGIEREWVDSLPTWELPLCRPCLCKAEGWLSLMQQFTPSWGLVNPV